MKKSGLTHRLVIVTAIAVLISIASHSPTVAADRGSVDDSSNEAQFNPGLFRRAFQMPNESARLAELHKAIAHIDDPRLPKALLASIKINLRQPTESVFEAISLYCQIDNEGLLDRQLEFAKSQNPMVATIAAEALSRRRVPAALDSLIELTKRREFKTYYGMRRAIVDAIARYPQKAAVEKLIEIMKEFPGQLRYETALHLQEMTGEKFGGFPEKWSEWNTTSSIAESFANSLAKPDENEDDSTEKPEEDSSKRRKRVDWPEDVPLFFDTDIYGKHILFVIDQSKSMLSTVNGKTRMSGVQEELEKAINELPDSVRFNILAYNEQRRFWKNRPVAATFQNKAAAIRFAYGLSPAKTTNIYEVLKQAIQHDRGKLELIVFLSDGKPTAGRVVQHSVIVNGITRMNRRSKISITAVGIDVKGADRHFLETLALKNSGVLKVMR